MEWRYLLVSMGIMDLFCITMDMDLHIMEHTLQLVLQFLQWVMMVNFIALNTTNMELLITSLQHLVHPTHLIQAPTPKADVSTSVASDQVPLSVETGNGSAGGMANGSVNSKGSVPLRPIYPNVSVTSNGSNGRGVLPGGASGYHDPRYGFDGMRSPGPWIDGPIFSNGQPRPATSSISSTVSNVSNIPSARSQNPRPLSHLMGLHPARPASGMGATHGYNMSRIYPNSRMYGSVVRAGSGFSSNGYDSRANGRGWLAVDNKYKPRGRGNGLFGYGNENMDGLNELNRGPRAGRFKNQKGFATNITLAVKGQNLPSKENEESPLVADRDQYNRAEFPVKYSDAKVF